MGELRCETLELEIIVCLRMNWFIEAFWIFEWTKLG